MGRPGYELEAMYWVIVSLHRGSIASWRETSSIVKSHYVVYSDPWICMPLTRNVINYENNSFQSGSSVFFFISLIRDIDFHCIFELLNTAPPPPLPVRT